MDEPTAALGAEETEKLHEIVRSLARAGRTVLLVSHFLREVLALADEVTVLRDGRVVRTSPAAEETEDSLIQAMLGRPLTAAFPPKRAAAGRRAGGPHGPRPARPGVEGVSFAVRAGEIVGLAGLVGAGRTELARAIFGADRPTAGSVELARANALSGGPRARLRAGVAMIPESRKDEGLLLGRSVTENVSLASLPSVAATASCAAGPSAAPREALDRWTVRARSPGAPVELALGRQPAEGALRAHAAVRAARAGRRRAHTRRRRRRQARDLRPARRSPPRASACC